MTIPLTLHGGPYARGRQQAESRPDLVPAVRAAVGERLTQAEGALARPDVRSWVEAQRTFTAARYPTMMEEIAGIADGYGIAAASIFDYLHCSIAAELAEVRETTPEGCTAFALTMPGGGAIVAKNRDYRREHIAIQQVFRHSDPGRPERSFLCVGSLGSPGNFSSGVNSEGLAVADTNIRTTDHGVGMHRYFLLTWLLERCATVADALAAIRGMPHAGGGVLVLGDAGGGVAAVELGHRRLGIECGGDAVGRTNHFVTPTMAGANCDGPGETDADANSRARLDELRRRLGEGRPDGDEAAMHLLATHDGRAALCRHRGRDLGETISASVYDTRRRQLLFTPGNACGAASDRFSLTADHPGENP